MPFEKGHEKMGGRQKGTPNRNTRELRIVLRRILESKIENIDDYIDNIKDDKQRLDVIVKLMPYVFPKIAQYSLYQMHDDKDGKDSFF